MTNLICGGDSYEGELPSRLPFSSIGIEKIGMTAGAKIDLEDLIFFYAFLFHLSDIDPWKVNHPLPSAIHR